MIVDAWNDMAGDPLVEGYSIREIGIPSPNEESISKCRELCGQNLCGTFNANWGCPPGVGTERECLGIVGKYSKAILLKKRFENIDFNDRSLIADIANGHQEVCRRFGNILRGKGYDTLPLADGGCTHCKSCSYPDAPCGFPDQRVTSVSCYGILMEDYMRSQGVDFSFEGNAMTMYGIMLYNDVEG